MNRDDAPQLKIFQRMRKQRPLSASAQTQKPVAQSAQNPAASGKAGDLSWTLDNNGALTIAGAGVVDGFTGTPWTPDNGTSLIIRDGVEGVGLLAFYGHKSLKISVTSLFAGAESRVALNNKNLSFRHIF